MPAEDAFALNDRKALAAILFLAASTNAMDVYSAVNSSPWTAESFGGDPAKAASVREYVRHALVLTSVMAVVSGYISRSWWPIVGMVLADGYMYWLYERALNRAVASQSKGFQPNGSGTPVTTYQYQ